MGLRPTSRLGLLIWIPLGTMKESEPCEGLTKLVTRLTASVVERAAGSAAAE